MKFKNAYRTVAVLLIVTFIVPSIIFTSPGQAFAATSVTDTYSTAGYTTWVVPDGVTSAIIACWGGGGAGANATNNNQGGGGGGGGGAFASSTQSVSPGDTIRLYVGAGGASSRLSGATSTASTTNPTLIVSAAPGWGGRAQVSGGTGLTSLGGAVASSTGTTIFAGGKGGGGADGGTSKDWGGGGGGAGGPNADGNNGTTAVAAGGTAGGQGNGTYGGAGGTGSSAGTNSILGAGGGGGGDDNASGGAGGSYGGGGGGSGNGGNGGFGPGGTGACTITYSVNKPTVTTSAASSVTASTATYNGDITADNATIRGFASGLTSTLTGSVSTSSSSGSFSVSSFTLATSSLTAVTTYYFRAYATNADGTGYGSIQSFTTGVAAAPTLTTDAATNIVATSSTLNATITDAGGTTVTSRGFATSTSATLSSSVATSTESGSYSTGAFSTTSASLTNNSTYYFRAFATNSAGTSYGSIQSFLTVPGAPGTPTSQGTFATTTDLTWTAPSGGATSYKLEQCVTGSSTCSLFTGISSNSTTTYSLASGTSYDFAVRSTNATGDSVWSSTSTIVTLYATTTLADATDPSNQTKAPGETAFFAGAFSLQAATNTTITSLVVDLGSGAANGVKSVEIFNSAGTISYGFAYEPSSDTPTITLNANTLTATSAPTIYKIKIKPKSHADMPSSPGATYSVQAKISSVTAGGAVLGSDTAGTTITIDNASPSTVTSATASAGDTSVNLSWTNPVDSDFTETVVLRATTTIATSTYEGTLYATSGTFTDLATSTNILDPALAALSSSTIVFFDWTDHVLQAYTWNGTTYAEAGTPVKLPSSDSVSLTALNDTDLVYQGSSYIRVYRFNGSTWSQVGNDFSVFATYPSAAALNSTDIADVDYDGTLVTYRWNGTTFTQVGSSLALGNQNNTGMTALNGTDVAFYAEGTDQLRVYRFNGSTWSQVGNSYPLSVTPPGITAISSTTVAVLDNSSRLLTFTFDGTNWSQVGNALQLSLNIGALATLNSSDIAFIDRAIHGFRTYRWDTMNWRQDKNIIGNATVVCATTGTTCSDTGLTNGTAYNYKIFSRDRFGNYSTAVIPTGSPATPNLSVPTLTTDAATSISATTTTLNANISSDGNASITARGFATSTSATLASSVATSTESGSFSTGAFSTTSASQTGNTTYYARAFATNSQGTGYGNIQTVLTVPDIPTSPTYTFTTATTTSVTWSAPTGGATTYKLEQCVTSTNTCSLFSAIGGNSTTTYSLTGNTNYDFSVRGNNATGDGLFSATTTQLTLPDMPSSPTFSNTLTTSLTVTWVGPVGSSSSYKIERCQGAGCSNFSQIASGVATNTYNDSGLSPGTTYLYRVRGVNATGDGTYSASASVLMSGGIITSGGMGGGSDIGGPPPAGQGTVGGGGEGGGGDIAQEIGGEPGFFAPGTGATASGWNGWINPLNGIVSDNVYAFASTFRASDYYNFGFNIPSTDIITGIAVKLEVSKQGGSAMTTGAELSWNNGTATTTSGLSTGALATSDIVYTLGGSSSLWGRSWIPSEFNNGNFLVRVTGAGDGESSVRLDAIQVNVYHQAGGGSSGGGSDI